MSKVICDVCGTTYPETAAQCPICGCAKTAAVDASLSEGDVGTYTYVKGGRFSKANVRKRNKANKAVVAYEPAESRNIPEDEMNDDMYDEMEEYREDTGSNRGLIVAVIVLLLAILAVGVYIYTQYFMPKDPGTKQPVGNTSASTSQTAQTTTESTVLIIPCTKLTLADTQITLDEIGKSWLLNVTMEPADTTDTLIFTSSDESVVTVSGTGTVTAVGPGQAEITITCGDVQTTCPVSCVIETTPPETEPPTEPAEVKISHKDVTLAIDEQFRLTLKVDGEAAEVEWTVKDSSICTITKKGTVTGKAKGQTTIKCTYNGETYSCIVRVSGASVG